MERNDADQTHDFMNVESFSQLPFIRRPSSLKEKSIRLFGKDFGGGGDSSPEVIISDDDDDGDYNSTETATESNKESGESNRKFECNYCCRNFPTSQALGGHQNAHKRERQQAKRAHLQSAMIHGSLTEAQMYGFMTYHRLTTALPPYHHHHHHQQPSLPPWGTTTANNGYSTTTSRFYGGSNNYIHSVPINGSPLAMWKHPTVRSSTFSDGLKTSVIGNRNNSQIRYAYEQKPNVQEQVSLDLHL